MPFNDAFGGCAKINPLKTRSSVAHAYTDTIAIHSSAGGLDDEWEGLLGTCHQLNRIVSSTIEDERPLWNAKGRTNASKIRHGHL